MADEEEERDKEKQRKKRVQQCAEWKRQDHCYQQTSDTRNACDADEEKEMLRWKQIHTHKI